MITLDFETEAIGPNPLWLPPRPVGLAIWIKGTEPFYVTDWTEMQERWQGIMDSGDQLLFHNAQFDLAVGLKWLGGERPHWSRVHDTMYLCFLHDPYSRSLGLKASAERYLDLPPEEEDELHEWIIANVSEATRKTAGAYISCAPVPLVARYAEGDVVRTRELYDFLVSKVPTEPYDRERQLAPILAENSRVGIRVDVCRLESDIDICTNGLTEVERRIYKYLGSTTEHKLTGVQLADALDRAGVMEKWFYTPTGRRSTAKDNLIQGINPEHTDLLDLLAYRSTLATCLNTFMGPWLQFAEEDGRVHTEWNQVANDEKGHSGARTGRLSSSRPNFQNPPNPFDWPVPDGLPPLPNMREYLLPEHGHVWVKRDFSSQEIRILAHFEDGPLMVAYINDPFLDPHTMAQELIRQITSKLYERKDVKITGFSIIYGSGVPGLASQLKRPPHLAFELREAYFKAMPAASQLAASTRRRGASGGVVTTWGGRQYPVEPPKVINGRVRTWEYKLLNYLIQGSAGDQTKQVLIDWYERFKDKDAVFLATIHDEINASVPEEDWEFEMRQLRRAMDQDLFDVPMRSEGFVGPNWGQLKELENEYER